MLKHLHIRNFTLIECLDIDFYPGFSVITGETGAGKSIILGAIGLLMGQRADSKMMKNNKDKCVIEAHFDISQYGMADFFRQNDIDYDDADCIIRRELAANGKSRAFINDTPVALGTLKELSENFIDIHSQHQNLLLNKQDFQLEVVDIIANTREQLTDYRKSYGEYARLGKELENLEHKIEQDRANADFLQYQFEEIENAKLTEEEQEELEQKASIMSHAEEIKGFLYQADHLLSAEDNGIISGLRSLQVTTSELTRLIGDPQDIASRIGNCYIELKDIAEEIGSRLEDIDFDPNELDNINSRLDKIYDLQKKYHCNTTGELLAYKTQLEQQLEAITNCDEIIEELRRNLSEAEQECLAKARLLSNARSAAARSIEQEMLNRLTALGMPNICFAIRFTEEQMNRNGIDRVSFLFSANKNMSMQPVSQVASGGEIARVMLSLKAMISNAVKLPTIIFDEIDTGVSGKIAERMADIMREMGDSGRQVISITHLPQIAALGSTHYKVEKQDTEEETVSRMRILDDDERIREIAQMLSGSDITEAAVNNAKALLNK